MTTRRMAVSQRLAWASLVFLAAGSARAAPAADPPPPRPPTTSELAVQAITRQLDSGNAAEVDAAVAAMKERIKVLSPGFPSVVGAARSDVMKAFRETWSGKLMQLKRYDDVEAIAVTYIVISPDTTAINAIQKVRVRNFHAAGKEEAALGAAKGYYNACSLKDTGDAVALVATALAHSRDGETVRRFRAQQAAGAATQPGAATADTAVPPGTTGGAPVPQDLGDSVLASIKVDGEPFKQVIEGMDAWDFKEMFAKANLLLLADRTKEAHELMQKAYDLAVSPGEIAAATEGVARAIRAEEGSVGKANAWLMSLKGK